jgi:ribosomal protein S18 acetylase RimI-like enzyme
VRFFEEEWQEERSLFGYTLCTAATLGNALMGIELGFDRATMREYEGGTGPRGYACLSLKGLETYQRYDAYLRYLSPSIPDDVYYIEFLSIAPRARGRGLGRRLLEQAFTRAKQAGHRACELDVSSDNLAVAFYRRMGMELLSESRVVPLEKRGVHSHYRMIKTPL